MNCTKVVFEKKVCHVPHMLKVTFNFGLGLWSSPPLSTLKQFYKLDQNFMKACFEKSDLLLTKS